jgi:hypothetical protein
MPRRVEKCPFRVALPATPEEELARCSLIEAPFGKGCKIAPIPRAACEACTSSLRPRPGKPNDVVASFIYTHASGILNDGSSPKRSAESAARILESAASELEIVWTKPNDFGWAGELPGIRSPGDVIDIGVICDTFTAHLCNSEPFTYIRYGDGEWLSILGCRGRNSDGQDYAPATLGQELRWTLEYAAGLWPNNERFYVGVHDGYYRRAVCRHLVESRLVPRVRWVEDNLFADGLNNLSTLRFLLAVQGFRGRKVLVANETLAPIARALRCHHIVVPRIDCHLSLTAIEDRCHFCEPSLVVCCAGMASEPLLCRLHRANPHGMYIDCGSVFDAIVGLPTRYYTQINFDDVCSTLERYYVPFLINNVEYHPIDA